jgi:ABC-type transport system involved in multi-copper enzyme maturation permease subunit
MINMLHMDIRRLFKTRGYYITMLVSLILLAIFATAGYIVTGLGGSFGPQMENMSMGDATPAMIAQARRMMDFNFFASFYLSHNSILHLLIALFAAGFISKDHQTGYFKNLLCIRSLRLKWLAGKLITMLLAAVIYYLVFLLGCALAVVLYGNPLTIDVSRVAAYFGLHLTVDMALFAVAALVVAALQTKTAAVIISLLLSFNIQAILYLLLDQLGLFPFKLQEWGMMSLASKLPLQGSFLSMMTSGDGTTAGQLLPVSLGVFAVFSLLSLLTLYRVDYKG